MTKDQKDYYQLSILTKMFRSGMITEWYYKQRVLEVLDS